MFAEVFKALKRVVDLTVAPLLIGVVTIALELTMGGLTWLFVKAADVGIGLVGGLLALFDFSGVNVNLGVFGQIWFEVMELAGLWDAAAVYFGGMILAFVLRMLTFGAIGRR